MRAMERRVPMPLAVGLLAALAAAVVVKGAELLSPRLVTQGTPYLPGETWTAELRTRVEGESAWPEEDCWTAFIMDPQCAACAALATQWLADPEGGPVPLYWLFAGPDSAVTRFLEDFPLDARSVRVITSARGEAVPLRELGIVATPTRVTISEDRRASEVIVSGRPLERLAAGVSCEIPAMPGEGDLSEGAEERSR